MKRLLFVSVLGVNATAFAGTSYQAGDNAMASGEYTTAVGGGAAATKKHATAFGGEAYAAGDKTVAVGAFSTSGGVNSIALGTASHSHGNNSIAIGTAANAGNNISSTVTSDPKTANTISIGNFSSAQHFNSIAIGTKSNTTRENEVNIGFKNSNNVYSNRLLGSVADGVLNTDAVNKRQLNKVELIADEAAKKAEQAEINSNIYTDNKSRETLNSATNYTDAKTIENNKIINRSIAQAKNEAVTMSNNYTNMRLSEVNKKTDERFNKVERRIDKVENKINAGIAGVTAISSIPYVNNEKFSFGMGVGNYKNGNAIAAGVQFMPITNTNFRVNASWDNENNSAIGAGVAIGW